MKVFWYWINERHKIYLKRKQHKPEPWTRDLILQKYKFTNPFRQLDRVTQEWVGRYATLLGTDHAVSEAKSFTRKPPTDGDILFHCAMFRLFNWPPTYDALYYSGVPWSYGSAMRILERLKGEGRQIFTGAYIVPNMGMSDPKIDIIAAAVDLVHENRVAMAAYIRSERSLEKTCEVLQLVPTIGPFIAYEIACDLRFTRLLADATDILCWANPGPGAKRGIHRLFSAAPALTKPRPDYLAVMRDLLKRAQAGAVSQEVLKAEYPFELREIEHSLCEFDKYMRVKNGEGRPRSLFKPSPPPPWEDNPVDVHAARKHITEAVKKYEAKKRRPK